jgi:hypothetical protein
MNSFKEYGLDPFPFGELHGRYHRTPTIGIQERLHLRSFKNMTPDLYLSSVESTVPRELISSENYLDMKRLASHFPRGVTSFFGFETRLNSGEARADYLFAVSSRKGEREALAEMLQNEQLPTAMMSQVEWQHLRAFTQEWTDPDSILYNKVLGLWLEFDTADNPSEAPVPCVFISPVPFRVDTPQDMQTCSWIIDSALPLITGHSLSKKIEDQVLNAFQHLPQGTSVFQVGVMLSRSTSGVRLLVNKIQPAQILPYLKALGWSDKNNEISSLIKELESYTTRIVLHINITEAGIDQKIGLECSYSPDLYHLETRWSSFLDYLIQKGVCLPEKKEALLEFTGVEQEDTNDEFDLKTFKTTVTIPDNDFSSAMVRYISHIKIVYKPHSALQAKAYSGVRHFGRPSPAPEEGIY